MVHAPTQRYNHKTRLGKGFTMQELKEAGVTPTYAKSVGIAVDHRRTNLSVRGACFSSFACRCLWMGGAGLPWSTWRVAGVWRMVAVSRPGAGRKPVRKALALNHCRTQTQTHAQQVESLQANVQRLKEYTAKLLVFPQGRVKKAKNAAELKNVRLADS